MLKSNKNCIIVVGILLLAFVSVGNTEVKYYRHIAMNNFQIMPRYPIDISIAGKVNCYRIEYDTDGEITTITYLHENNIDKSPEYGFATLSIIFHDQNQEWHYLNKEGNSIFGDTGLFQATHYFDESGKPVSQVNYNKNGKIIEDTSGVAKYIYEGNTVGQILSSLSTDIKGDTIIDKYGYYKTKYLYDIDGNIAEVDACSKDGRLINPQYGSSVMKCIYDSNRNVTQIEFFDDQRKPIYDMTWKASKLKSEYDEYGNISHGYCFGDKGASSDSLFLSIDSYYDFSGNKIKMTVHESSEDVEGYYDSDGSNTKTIVHELNKNDDLDSTYYQYNKSGQIISELYIYRTDSKKRLAKVEVIHDSLGSIIDTIYYDKKGNIYK